MEDTLFRARMTGVAEAFDEERYAESLDAARSLKHDLIAAAQLPGSLHGPEEGQQLGWARFYEVKCLFALGEWQALVDRIATPEPVGFTVGAKNAGWMFSVATEAAFHCGDLDRVEEWGERCYELRQLLTDDPMSVFHCVHMVLQLLESADAPERNRVWAERMLAIGREHGAERPVISAVNWLCDHVDRTGHAGARQTALDARPELERYARGEFADEARAVLQRLGALESAA